MEVKRILFTINCLSQGPETISSLHRKLESAGFTVSQRTVYRDLTKLETTFNLGNIRLRRYNGEFNKATWLIVKESGSANFRQDLFFQTFLTEHFKPDWLKSFTGNTIEDVFNTGYGIDPKDALLIQQEIAQFSIHNSNWGEFIYNEKHHKLLKDFIWAITNERVVYISFFDHTAEVERRFKPLKVILHRGTLHIAGWLFEGEAKTLQVQELDCIRAIRKTNDRYDHHEEDSILDQSLRDRFGIHDADGDNKCQIVLQMREGPAIFLKNRNWHPTQTFRQEGEFWYMEFTATINIELIGWIFSWLEHVKVVAPPILCDLMARRAAFITRLYEKNLPPVGPVNTDNPYLVGE